jgi:VWFA-related protein
MYIAKRVGLLFLLPLLSTAALSSAQQQSPRSKPGGSPIYLDVVVTRKSGPPVSGLEQQDFTLIDNKLPQTITSFRALGGTSGRVEVLVVVDAVNVDFEKVAYVREEIDKFLRADGGHLAQPTTLAFFTDQGIQVQEGLSTDGNALSAALDKYTVALRTIRRDSQYSGADRFNLSMQALRQIASRETQQPGRKMILWISPGWPLLSSPGDVELLDSKEQQGLFSNIVSFSTELLQARITLYSIDPLGATESEFRANYYEEFVKGVKEPSQVVPGNLALQVIARQSGGLALDFNNDVAALLRQCLADTQAYYELSFDAPEADKRDEYHQLEVKVAKPGLTARTRQGYYAQPAPR